MTGWPGIAWAIFVRPHTMRRARVPILLLGCLSGPLLAQEQGRFVENRGQWPPRVTHKLELPAASLWMEHDGWTVVLHDGEAIARLHAAHSGHDEPYASPVVRHHAVRLRFEGASPDALVSGNTPLPGVHNYFIGNDPSRWGTDAHGFRTVRHEGLYAGVDMEMRTDGLEAKYDLYLAAGVPLDRVALRIEGADSVHVDPEGLVIFTSLGALKQRIPRTHRADGTEVHCSFRMNDGVVRFAAEEDRAQALVIDPTLEFSTYSGSTSDNFGYTATFDNDGFLYSGSTAFGQGYPTTLGAYQTIHAGGNGLGDGTDIAITKYDTTGTFFIWSTFLGEAGTSSRTASS